MLLDLAQDTVDRLRLRRCVFLHEYPSIFYGDINDETDKIELSRTTHSKKAQPKFRKAIISKCNRELLNCISECVLNVLNGNLHVPNCGKQKLRKHKEILRKVADKSVSYSIKYNLSIK